MLQGQTAKSPKTLNRPPTFASRRTANPSRPLAKGSLLAGHYCGKIIGEYLEKLIDYNHPPERVQKLITYLIGAFERVAVVTPDAPTKPSDPDDEVFLLCALDGQAHYLVSEDGALLDLKPNYTRPVIGKSIELAPVLGA
jgi:hypothetical protein